MFEISTKLFVVVVPGYFVNILGPKFILKKIKQNKTHLIFNRKSIPVFDI